MIGRHSPNAFGRQDETTPIPKPEFHLQELDCRNHHSNPFHLRNSESPLDSKTFWVHHSFAVPPRVVRDFAFEPSVIETGAVEQCLKTELSRPRSLYHQHLLLLLQGLVVRSWCWRCRSGSQDS